MDKEMKVKNDTFGAEYLNETAAPVHGGAKGGGIYLGDGHWLIWLDGEYAIV